MEQKLEQKPAANLADILTEHEAEILSDWLALQRGSAARRADLIGDAELQRQSKDFLAALRQGASSGKLDDIMGADWTHAREVLADISRSRARLGFTPTETATFVFSLKQPLARALSNESTGRDELWTINIVLDRLGLFTTELYQKSREEVILKQQREMLELSTPVVKLWDGILALPLIGTLDSERTQVVMESLLQSIVDSGAAIAIIDITGVPTVDTLVAQHLLKTVAAARLMGAECIISGIRPQIAATIVHLGVDLSTVVTKATLADAFSVALNRTGQAIQRGRHNSTQEGGAVERIPILKLGEFLLVSIQVDMHDRLAMTLQEDLTDRIVKVHARGVLIDISSLDVVDSFIGRMLGHIADMSRILDAETVVVGMQPAVAITLVELGLSLPGIRTALNVEKGMDLLRRASEANRRQPGKGRHVPNQD